MSSSGTTVCKTGITPHGMMVICVPNRESPLSLFFTDWDKLAGTGIVERAQHQGGSALVAFTDAEIELVDSACCPSRPAVDLRGSGEPASPPATRNGEPSKWRSFGLDHRRVLLKTVTVTERSRNLSHTVAIYQKFVKLPLLRTWVREPFGCDMIVGDVGALVRMNGMLYLRYAHGHVQPVTSEDPDFQ